MNVMLGVAFVALIVGAVLVQFWPAIEALSGGSAAFLGALAGAAAGLGGILAGALYNAKLNRDENKRLRSEQARTLVVGLRAELIALMDDAVTRVGTVELLRGLDDPVRPPQVTVLDLRPKVVFTSNTHRLGDLGGVGSLRVIAAHTMADHVRNNIATVRAHGPDEFVDDNGLENLGADFQQLVQEAALAVNALDAFLGEPASYPDPESVLDQVKAADAVPEPSPKVSAK